eukprot:6208869-Pleurochrysis_carterae.AAC.3
MYTFRKGQSQPSSQPSRHLRLRKNKKPLVNAAAGFKTILRSSRSSHQLHSTQVGAFASRQCGEPGGDAGDDAPTLMRAHTVDRGVCAPGQCMYHAAKHCECWAATPAAAPFGPRKTIGTLICAPDM